MLPLADIGELKEWARGRLDNAPNNVLDQCMLAASTFVEQYTSRVYARTTYTLRFGSSDFHGRNGEVILLPRSFRPVIYDPPTDDVVVVERGVTLTVASGYTTTASVVIESANVESQARLIRRPTGLSVSDAYGSDYSVASGWSRGNDTVAVTFAAGFATVPDDIRHAVFELSWLFYADPATIGKASTTRAGKSTSFADRIPERIRVILDARKAA